MKSFFTALLVLAGGCFDLSDEELVVSGEEKISSGNDKEEICLGGEYYGDVVNSAEETFELFLRNPFNESIEFCDVELDGRQLSFMNPNIGKALKGFNFEFKGKGARPEARNPRGVVYRWCQFYPNNIIEPGAYASFQINFKGCNTLHVLKLRTKCGKEIVAEVPRTSRPLSHVTYASFPGDGSVMNLRTQGRGVPKTVGINGLDCKIQVLRASASGMLCVTVVNLENPVSEGDVVYAEVKFEDGSIDRFLIRAMLGVSVEAPGGQADNEPLPEQIRKKIWI